MFLAEEFTRFLESFTILAIWRAEMVSSGLYQTKSYLTWLPCHINVFLTYFFTTKTSSSIYCREDVTTHQQNGSSP